MTIDTIRRGMPIEQALRVKADHYSDDRPRWRRRCVACGQRWLRAGLLRVGCRAYRTADVTLAFYRPPRNFVEAVTATLPPPLPVEIDAAPAAPPMRAASDTAPASRPRTGDGDTIDTATTVNIQSAFGGYRRGPHASPVALDVTVELPAVVLA